MHVKEGGTADFVIFDNSLQKDQQECNKLVFDMLLVLPLRYLINPLAT